MRKKKSNKGLITLFIISLIIILVLLISFSSNRKDNTKLSLSEKRWIENNKKDVINVSIANNIPAFSNEGKGVFFNYVDYLESETGLSFNLIPYEASDELQENDLYFEIIKGNAVNKLSSKEMIFYKDYYVLVSKKLEKISEPSNIRNKKIGILSDDLSDVSYYISSDNGVSYSSYEKESELKEALNNDSVDYIAVPKTRYLSYIVGNNYHIIYNITEFKESYVLKTNKNVDKALNNISYKNYLKYKENRLKKDYNNFLMDLYMLENNISEKSKADFLGKKYVFGYIENEPYTSTINNKLIGLDSTYLNSFSNLSGSSFLPRKYRNLKDLTNALNAGNVDIAPNYYNYANLSGNYSKTISPYNEQYVVLVSDKNSDIVVNSVRSLKNQKVLTTNTTLANYIKKKGKAEVLTYDKISMLSRKIRKDSIIVLDNNVYEMFKDSKLSHLKVVYTDKENLDYGFIINDTNENKTFKTLFTVYMEGINYKQLYNVAGNEFKSDSKEINHTLLYFIMACSAFIVIWLFAT